MTFINAYSSLPRFAPREKSAMIQAALAAMGLLCVYAAALALVTITLVGLVRLSQQMYHLGTLDSAPHLASAPNASY